MNGLHKYTKRNMMIITLFFTICVLFYFHIAYVDVISGYKDAVYDCQMQSYDPWPGLFLEELENSLGRIFYFVVIPLILAVALQHRGDKVGKAGEFLASLPVKKEKIFKNRFFIGVLMYTIPWLFVLIEVIVVRMRYDGWYQESLAPLEYASYYLKHDNVQSLVFYMIYLWLLLTMVYVLATWVQNICRRPWIAAAITYGMVIFPYIIDMCIEKALNWSIQESIGSLGLLSVFGVGDVTKELWNVIDQGSNSQYGFSYLPNMVPIFVIQMIFIVVFFIWSYQIYIKKDLSEKQEWMYIPWMATATGFGLCFSIVTFVLIMGFGLERWMSSGRGALISCLLLSILIDYLITRWKRKRRMG